MTTKRATSKTRGVGQPTKKTKGFMVTSLRLLVKQNRELRKHARNEGLSFNGWAVSTLLNAARKGITTNGEAST